MAALDAPAILRIAGDGPLRETIRRWVRRRQLEDSVRLLGYCPNPYALLRQADVELTKLRFYLRLCRDLQLMSIGQYRHAAQMVNEVGRLLGGWRGKASGTAKRVAGP